MSATLSFSHFKLCLDKMETALNLFRSDESNQPLIPIPVQRGTRSQQTELAECTKMYMSKANLRSDDVHQRNGFGIKDIYRDALGKEYELTIEVIGQVLQKVLINFYCVSRQEVKAMTYKNIIRKANEAGLIDKPEKWFAYRDNRNITAHEYGIEQVEEIIRDIEIFINDAKFLHETLEQKHGTASA